MDKTFTIRFYEELNDHLKKAFYKKDIQLVYKGPRTVKDVIESFNIPHSEVDLILINGHSVDLNHKVKPGDQISVYPVFERFNIDGLTKVRPQGLRHTKFIVDYPLQALGRKLRLLGFDTLIRRQVSNQSFIEIANDDKRILLSTSPHLLKHKSLERACLVREETPFFQCLFIMNRLDLWSSLAPFSRCLNCNHKLEPLTDLTTCSDHILSQIPKQVTLWCKSYLLCPQCSKVYWQGHHYRDMSQWIDALIKHHQTLEKGDHHDKESH